MTEIAHLLQNGRLLYRVVKRADASDTKCRSYLRYNRPPPRAVVSSLDVLTRNNRQNPQRRLCATFL